MSSPVRDAGQRRGRCGERLGPATRIGQARDTTQRALHDIPGAARLIVAVAGGFGNRPLCVADMKDGHDERGPRTRAHPVRAGRRSPDRPAPTTPLMLDTATGCTPRRDTWYWPRGGPTSGRSGSFAAYRARVVHVAMDAHELPRATSVRGRQRKRTRRPEPTSATADGPLIRPAVCRRRAQPATPNTSTRSEREQVAAAGSNACLPPRPRGPRRFSSAVAASSAPRTPRDGSPSGDAPIRPRRWRASGAASSVGCAGMGGEASGRGVPGRATGAAPVAVRPGALTLVGSSGRSGCQVWVNSRVV